MTTMGLESIGPDTEFAPDGEYDVDVDEEDGEEDESSESESEDGESRRSRARGRQAAMRRRELARLRATRKSAVRAPAAPVSVSTAVRRTQAAVREVDLQNKVQADTVSSAMRVQGRRTGGVENALAASIVVAQLQNAFGKTRPLDNTIARIGLPLTPLLFLRRPKGGPVWRNPQVAAPVLVAAIVAGKDVLASTGVYDVRFTSLGPATGAGQKLAVRAVAIGWRGQVLREIAPSVSISGDISEDAPGIYKLGKAGNSAAITASADGVSTTHVINIV